MGFQSYNRKLETGKLQQEDGTRSCNGKLLLEATIERWNKRNGWMKPRKLQLEAARGRYEQEGATGAVLPWEATMVAGMGISKLQRKAE